MTTNEIFNDKWNPPVRSNDSAYGFNSVKQTKGGHVFEIDDTPGSERIAEHHKSGTSRTIVADGSSEITIVGDSWVTIIRDGQMYIKGNVNVTMEQTVKLHCKKLEVEAAEMHTNVHGDYSLHVDGNYILEVVGDVSEKIVGGKKFECGHDFDPIIHGSIHETIGHDYTSTTGSYNMMATSYASITGGLLGTSISSSGKVSIGGTMVGVDALLQCKITGIAGVNITTPIVTVKAPSVLANTSIIKCLDVVSSLTGTKTLSTHIHKALGPLSPTSPPIL